MQKMSKILALVAILAVVLPAGAALAEHGSDNTGDHNNTTVNTQSTTTVGVTNTRGMVTSVSGMTINMTGEHGTIFVVDATNAKLIRAFGAAMQIGDIQVNDKLLVTGTVTPSGVTATAGSPTTANIAATVVRDLSLQARHGTFVGKITALSGTSFTLNSKERGDQTINTDSNTVIRLADKTAAFSDLAVGETVTVSGVWDRTNSNVTATKITIRVVGVNIRGTLQSVSGTTLTVMTDNNTTYTVDASNARIRTKSGKSKNVDLSMFKTGDMVRVQGRMISGSTKITANEVRDLSLANSESQNQNSQNETENHNNGNHQ